MNPELDPSASRLVGVSGAEPLKCEGCGRTIAQHDKLLHCYPEAAPVLADINAEIWDDIERALIVAMGDHCSPDLDELDSSLLLELVLRYRRGT